MTVVKAAHMMPHPQAAKIIMRILHLVIRVRGRVIDRYLCILICMSVCIDVIKHVAFRKLLIVHRTGPNTHSWAIKVAKENGASKIPIRKSATAKLTRNIFVLVRMPRCLTTTAITIRFPNIARIIDIDNHVPKTICSVRENVFRALVTFVKSVMFEIFIPSIFGKVTSERAGKDSIVTPPTLPPSPPTTRSEMFVMVGHEIILSKSSFAIGYLQTPSCNLLVWRCPHYAAVCSCIANRTAMLISLQV